jgi:hypothetical protein
MKQKRGLSKMEIKGKVHCFFEQSGTFKNEFIKLGILAEDYDIQNNFGETDHVIDLFAEIEKAYEGEGSIFDNITQDDLIIAFFPCTYFTGSTNPRYYTLENNNYRWLNLNEKLNKILERNQNRNIFYEKIVKLVGISLKKEIRLIIENPYSTLHYLHNNFFKNPDIFDTNRLKRGDYYKKPTGYWFFNCEPTYGTSYQNDKEKRIIFKSKDHRKDFSTKERSMISPDYARNFICDFILGKTQDCIAQRRLF